MSSWTTLPLRIDTDDKYPVLEWIHGCGWVHRDISVGNLYFLDGRGLVGDLEYAKRRNYGVKRERRVVRCFRWSVLYGFMLTPRLGHA